MNDVQRPGDRRRHFNLVGNGGANRLRTFFAMKFAVTEGFESGVESSYGDRAPCDHCELPRCPVHARRPALVSHSERRAHARLRGVPDSQVGLETWHVVEHGVIISNAIANDGCSCPGIGDAALGLSDAILHFFYNTVANTGVVIAFAFVVRVGRAVARGASPVLSSNLIARRPSRAGSDGRVQI